MLETAITTLVWVLIGWVGILVAMLSIAFFFAVVGCWIAKKIMDDNY